MAVTLPVGAIAVLIGYRSAWPIFLRAAPERCDGRAEASGLIVQRALPMPAHGDHRQHFERVEAAGGPYRGATAQADALTR